LQVVLEVSPLLIAAVANEDDGLGWPLWRFGWHDRFDSVVLEDFKHLLDLVALG